MRYLLLLFIFSCPALTQAQATDGVDGNPSTLGAVNELIASRSQYGSRAKGNVKSYEQVQAEYAELDGSPFLYGKELVVDLVDAEGNILENKTILYDLYNHEIAVKKEDGSIIVLDQLYYKGFYYTNENGEEERFLRTHPTNKDFCLVLYQSGDLKVCKELMISITKDNTYVPGQGTKKAKFTKSQNYFVVKGKDVNFAKLRKEALFALLPPAYRKQVPAIKRSLRIKKMISKEKDYIRVFKAMKDPNRVR